MKNRTWRVGFIGCGAIALKHAEILQTLSGVRIAAAWNRSPERAEALVQRYGGKAVSDWESIMTDSDIDAIYLNTMHNDRLRFIRAAAASGKPVFCEKPLAHNAETLRDIRMLVHEKGLFFQSGYKTRFHSGMVAARAYLDTTEVIHAQVFDETWPETGLNDAEIGGGNVLSQGVYAAECAYLLAGSRPESVAAFMRDERHVGRTPDTLCATFRFENGAVATVTVGDAGLAPDPVGKFLVTAAGANRCIALTDRFQQLDCWSKTGTQPQSFRFVEDGFRIQSERFFAALTENSPSPVPVEEGIIPSLMMMQAVKAAQTQRVVSCKEW